MSGPIVRKYGFPNFDKIFGKREVEHGVDQPRTDPEETGLPPEKTPQTASPDQPGPAEEAPATK